MYSCVDCYYHTTSKCMSPKISNDEADEYFDRDTGDLCPGWVKADE